MDQSCISHFSSIAAQDTVFGSVLAILFMSLLVQLCATRSECAALLLLSAFLFCMFFKSPLHHPSVRTLLLILFESSAILDVHDSYNNFFAKEQKALRFDALVQKEDI
jgi:hypothetical protein